MSRGDASAPERAVGEREDFRGIIEGLARTRSSVTSVFGDFCRMVACALANQTREDEYFQAIKGYSKDDLNQLAKAMAWLINEMEDNPFADVLGTYYTQINSTVTAQARGEFYTPPALSRLLAEMNLEPEKVRAEGKPVTVCDPAGGSGGIILACAEALAPDVDLMRATLQDIAPVSCDMAYINTSLWGIPAEVILGDTLRGTVTARWVNIHWARVGEEERRRGLRMLDAFKQLTEPSKPQRVPTPAETTKPTPDAPHHQMDLF